MDNIFANNIIVIVFMCINAGSIYGDKYIAIESYFVIYGTTVNRHI